LLLFNYCFLVSLPGVVGDGAGVGLVLLPPELPPDMPPELLPPVELLPVAPAPAPLFSSLMHFSRSAPVRLTHLLGTSLDAPAAPLAPEPDEPLAPEEPEVWAIATDDRASAAAAAVSIFTNM
jgi:hypothetical protein